MGNVTHYVGDQCPGGHYEETIVPEPMTDADLDTLIGHAEYGHFEGQDYDAVETLVAEVRRLRAIERVARNAARHPEDGGDRIMWALLYGEGVTDAH